MASPLATGKQSVDMAAGAVRVSRIRRDPPPKVKEKPPRDPDVRDTRVVVIGILTFALAFFVIALAVSSYVGWTPRNYVANL